MAFPHNFVGQEDSARQATCLFDELYLPVQAGGNYGSELGCFHRALTVEAHMRQERDFGENPPPAPTLTGGKSLPPGAARLSFFLVLPHWHSICGALIGLFFLIEAVLR